VVTQYPSLYYRTRPNDYYRTIEREALANYYHECSTISFLDALSKSHTMLRCHDHDDGRESHVHDHRDYHHQGHEDDEDDEEDNRVRGREEDGSG
jgi:hypothetical protein